MDRFVYCLMPHQLLLLPTPLFTEVQINIFFIALSEWTDSLFKGSIQHFLCSLCLVKFLSQQFNLGSPFCNFNGQFIISCDHFPSRTSRPMAWCWSGFSECFWINFLFVAAFGFFSRVSKSRFPFCLFFMQF